MAKYHCTGRPCHSLGISLHGRSFECIRNNGITDLYELYKHMGVSEVVWAYTHLEPFPRVLNPYHMFLCFYICFQLQFLSTLTICISEYPNVFPNAQSFPRPTAYTYFYPFSTIFNISEICACILTWVTGCSKTTSSSRPPVLHTHDQTDGRGFPWENNILYIYLLVITTYIYNYIHTDPEFKHIYIERLNINIENIWIFESTIHQINGWI